MLLTSYYFVSPFVLDFLISTFISPTTETPVNIPKIYMMNKIKDRGNVIPIEKKDMVVLLKF